jgi:prepilin-type N-terminal cleavage/methylation domain-containing protein
MIKWPDERGLTFVEMMVSITIFSILIISLYGLLESGMSMFQFSDSHLEQMQNMRVAMESIGRDIRKAKSVDFNSTNKELTIRFQTGTEKYGLGNESTYGPSGLNGKKLWITTTSNPLASYLTDFNVTIVNNLVTVKLTATSPKGKLLTLENSFALRN